MFEYFGRKAGKAYKKGRWFYDSLLGDEDDAVKAEFSFGYEMAKDISAQSEFVKDELVKSIGSKIKGTVSSRHRFNYYVIKSHEVNAFALPGGFIFLTDSLLNLCGRDKDEIAFVLCHEMSHVIKGHAMEKIMAEYSIKTLAGLLKTTGLLQNAAKQVVSKYLTSSYSRDNEFEADLLGTKIMIKCGYNGEGAVKLLGRLKGTDSGPVTYLSSHPDIETRIEEVRNYLNR